MAKSNFLQLLEAAERYEKRQAESSAGPGHEKVPSKPTPEAQVEAPAASAPQQEWWTAEGIGGIFPASRIRPIQRAQDAMNHIEEAVYDALWGSKKITEHEESRIVRMGYGEMADRARVSKRGVQGIADRLIAKHVIEVETPADIYRKLATVYRVFSYAAIRKLQRETGRHAVIRIARGVFYVRKLNPQTVEAIKTSTVEDIKTSTVEVMPCTVEATQCSTVEATQTSTVEVASTVLLIGNKKNAGTTSTSTPLACATVPEAPPVPRAIAEAFREETGYSDDHAVRKIVTACRSIAPDATDDEIARFLRQQAARAKNNPKIGNLVGLLIWQVPRCFEGEPFTLYREAERKRQQAEQKIAEARDREFLVFQAEQRQILDNPKASAEDKKFARKFLGLETEA